MLNKFIALFFFCICFVEKGYIYANPDVWVKSRITYYFEDHLVTQLTYLWNFDDFFSSRTIKKYDRNNDGIFESEELALLQREIFDPLSQFNYHVNIWKEGNKLKKIMAKNFKARIETKKLIFELMNCLFLVKFSILFFDILRNFFSFSITNNSNRLFLLKLFFT